jgi:hypothetical protein
MLPVPLSALAIALLITLAAPPAHAQTSALTGSWKGGGVVSFVAGEREKIRCRATFKRWSRTTVRMNAVCATSAVRIVQTALLRRVARNRYTGTFHNDEYGVSGRIRITVRGRRLRASLSGDSGTAVLRLRR